MKQIILGSLLGDGSLINSKGSKNVYFREQHSPKQKDYLIWKSNNLTSLGSKITTYTVKDTLGNKQKIVLGTKKLSVLTELRKVFYPNGKKIVSEEILNQINELGLAVWYCDDGSYEYYNNTCIICSQDFSFEEHLLIQKWFMEKLGIEVKIQKRKINYKNHLKEQYSLRFTKGETEKFLNLIKPFVLQMPKCMWYKLGHLIEDNKERVEFFKKRVKEKYKKYYYKNYIKKHREEINKRALERYYKNREKYLKRRKEYYQKNKEREGKYNKKYYEKHKEKRKIYDKIRYQKNQTISLAFRNWF
jgi:hypothetical protein